MGRELHHRTDARLRRISELGAIDRQKADDALLAVNENLRVQAEQLWTLNEALQLHREELEVANDELREQEQELQCQAEALRESEQRYRTLFETAPDAIVMHRDECLLNANEAALRLVGAGTPQELGRHTVLDFFRPQDRKQAAERIRLAMTGHRLPMQEGTLLRLDSQEVAVEFHTSAVDFQGRPAVQTIIRDIAERKRAEAALREWSAALENTVVQRTAELEHRTRQLRELMLESSRVEERERRRVAEVLHEDLQQQLAGAKFYVNSLGHRARSDSARQEAAEINRLLRVVIGMSRDLSHELSPAAFYGNDLGEAVEWLAEHLEASEGLMVRVEAGSEVILESESLMVFLFRATSELLSNVVRHAAVREAKIRLRRRGRYVGLRVSDRGRGFDPRRLRDTAGFGLLGIRERVELRGGRMMVRSVQNRGTVVRIVVPEVPASGATAQ